MMVAKSGLGKGLWWVVQLAKELVLEWGVKWDKG
jgi:hypothetical protein